MVEITGDDMIDRILATIVATGSVNWLFVTVLNTDLLTDVLGLGTEAANAGFLLIGLVGALNLYAVARDATGGGA